MTINRRLADDLIDDRIVEDLLVEVNPDLEIDADGCMEALAAQVKPALGQIADAFRQLADVRDGEAVFRHFVENMLAAA